MKKRAWLAFAALVLANVAAVFLIRMVGKNLDK